MDPHAAAHKLAIRGKEDRCHQHAPDAAEGHDTEPPCESETDHELEQWLEDCESCPLRRQAEQAAQLTSAIGAFDQRFAHVEESIGILTEQLGVIQSELKRLKTDEQVLSDLRDRHSVLYERHHEREVLRPLFLAVVGILDRCGETTANLEKWLARHAGKSSTPAYKATRRLLDARRADQAELEGLLAGFGVESFQQERDEFDPSTQKAVRRVETDAEQLHGTIAERLRPGYRRSDLIVRQEYVSVHAHRNSQSGKKKEVRG